MSETITYLLRLIAKHILRVKNIVSASSPLPLVTAKAINGRIMWILDNGHGALQEGKQSPALEDGRIFYEWEFNWDIVKRIAKRCDQLGLKHYLANPSPEKVGSWLRGRVVRANKLNSGMPEVYISVHSNAAPSRHGEWCSPNISGVETFYFSGASMRIAKEFQREIIESTGWKDRGVKYASFFVLTRTDMPAILTESGFFNNKEQCIELFDNAVRDKIADAHIRAMIAIEQSDMFR